jgi:hypothetical protein
MPTDLYEATERYIETLKAPEGMTLHVSEEGIALTLIVRGESDKYEETVEIALEADNWEMGIEPEVITHWASCWRKLDDVRLAIRVYTFVEEIMAGVEKLWKEHSNENSS